MSTAQPQPHKPALPQEITLRAHSNIFYMWPVWLVGFVFGLITGFSGQVVAVVPEGTEAKADIEIQNIGKRDVLIVDKEKALLRDKDGKLEQPKRHIAGNKNLGSWFLFITVLCIFFSTVTVRGWVAISIVSTIVFLVIIFNLTGVWDNITAGLGLIDVRINQGGYIFFSSMLFALWIIVVCLYDRQVYMKFTPRQVRVVEEVGDAEKVFDATGLNFQKLRTDPFRYILGFGCWPHWGAGDLVVHTGGAHPQTIEFANVLRLGLRIKDINRLLQTQEVSAG